MESILCGWDVALSAGSAGLISQAENVLMMRTDHMSAVSDTLQHVHSISGLL